MAGFSSEKTGHLFHAVTTALISGRIATREGSSKVGFPIFLLVLRMGPGMSATEPYQCACEKTERLEVTSRYLHADLDAHAPLRA